jgi:hypothetical protein
MIPRLAIQLQSWHETSPSRESIEKGDNDRREEVKLHTEKVKGRSEDFQPIQMWASSYINHILGEKRKAVTKV